MAAPTGDILKFINDFNKDYDKEIDRIKSDSEEAKTILASLITISTPKSTPYPIGDGSVKTIGDLFKYIYNLETGTDRTLKDKGVETVNGVPVVDSAKVEIYKNYLKDIDGQTLTPPDPSIKEKRKKVEAALSGLKRRNQLIELKKPQGKNPSLWSPGQYYFDVVMKYTKDEINNIYNYEWSSSYENDIKNNKQKFNFSISSFNKDGNYKKLPIKPGYRARDGQASYLTFRYILEESKQDIDGITGIDIGIDEWTSNDKFPSIKTKYTSGTKAELKQLLDSSTDVYLLDVLRIKGPVEFSDASDNDIFQGHYELIGLYKAFLQAGDNYKPVTLPLVQSTPPPPTTTADVPVAATQSSSATQSGTQSATEPTFVFDVQDEKIFFCKNPQIEYYIMPEGNNVPQPVVYKEDSTIDEEDVLSEEYSEVSLQVEDPVALEIVSPQAALDMMNSKQDEQEKVSQDTVVVQTSTQTQQLPPVPTSSQAAPKLPGGGSMTGKVNTDYKRNGTNWGKVTKGMTDAQLLYAMVTYIEGGYYYPAHAYSKFSEKARALYGASGETLWGIDRCAGQTEKTPEGQAFWGEVDKLSGYGPKSGTTGYARQTKTKDWNYSSYPTINSAWEYNYSPKPGSPGYDIMYNSFVKYATGNLNKYLDKYFGTHPVKNLILNDSRFKFMWFRSTWNGVGWFTWYSIGNTKKGINGLKWAYDNVTKNVDELIVWDLNNRLLFKTELITHDVKKMSELLGIK